MVELKKVAVYMRAGEPGQEKVTIEGDDLSCSTVGSDMLPLLLVKDGGEGVALFQNWDYWMKVKEE